MPWLQLIRWNNLLIIFLTQLLAWWCVILPASPAVLQPVNFLLLSLSTVLIAAAGYIINDYFDIRIDRINKPGKVVLEQIIPRKQAIIAHAVLNVIALALAGIVAARAHHYEWLLLQFSCIALLWFYSTHFKRQYVTGNVAISLLTSLTIVALLVYEPGLQRKPRLVLAVYACFAFMLTWMREIVKDMEDHNGDEAEGCVTMPVKKGLRFSRNFTLVLCTVVLVLLAAITGQLYHFGLVALCYYVALIVAAILSWSIFMGTGPATATHYRRASAGLKAIMLLGICSLLIYHFQ